MSETPNNEELVPEGSYDDGGYGEGHVSSEEIAKLPQASKVLLPVIMRKGEGLAALGDAEFDPETNKMVVSFNTPAGRDIAEFIGSGVLAAISFSGHMSRNETTNRLN